MDDFEILVTCFHFISYFGEQMNSIPKYAHCDRFSELVVMEFETPTCWLNN